jgi:hypothetical protein
MGKRGLSKGLCNAIDRIMAQAHVIKPRKGSLAICGLGCLGLVTEDKPKEVKYPDGNKGMAYVGIHLTDKLAPVGSPWSSRNPRVLCHVDDLQKT